MVFMKNETALLCTTMRERAKAFVATATFAASLQLFDIAFSLKKFSFCCANANAFWHGN